jgi:hypothetical protein
MDAAPRAGWRKLTSMPSAHGRARAARPMQFGLVDRS